MRLHFEVTGSGPPVVVTSGIGDSSEAWSSLFDVLRQRSRVLKWDLRGHGASESSADPADYSMELAVHDLTDMMSAAGASPLNPAVLIGHSLGGYLSLRVAISHPELVKALVLVSSGPGFRDEVARSQWNQYLHSMDLGRHVDPNARFLGVQSDGTVLANLPSVKSPTLILVGRDDRRFRGAADLLGAKLPHSTTVIIDGGRHSIHKTHPAEVNRAVVDFLEGGRLIMV